MKAIEEGYKTKLTVHRYPFTAFYIKINPELIDVNVHPTKMEVRFHNESIIYEAIKNGIYEALRKVDLIPEVSLNNGQREIKKTNNINKDVSIPEPFEKNRLDEMRKDFLREKTNDYEHNNSSLINTFKKNSELTNKKVLKELNLDTQERINRESTENKVVQQPEIISNNNLTNETKTAIIDDKNNELSLKPKYVAEQAVLFDDKIADAKAIKSYKIIGQLFNTYWIVELEEKLYIIDQHAAHERVLYERLMNKLRNSDIMSQGLLQPIIIQVSIREKQLIKDYKQLFSDLGFEIEEFGKDAYAIRSVPYIFNKSLSDKQFIEILDSLNEHYEPDKYNVVRNDIATMACKAAVKAHDKLTVLEYEKLFDELLEIEDPFTCPHGRPTIISMTKYELEKKFKRIQ